MNKTCGDHRHAGGRKKCAFCFLTENETHDGPAASTPAANGCRHSFSVGKRHDVYGQGDPGDGFFYLISGLVALTLMDVRGNTVFVRLVGGGETFGYRSFLAEEDHSVTATTLTPARYCHLEQKAAEGLFASDDASQRLFIRQVARSLRHANEARLRALSMTVRERLVQFLLALADKARGEEAGNLTITLPMSRADMAHLIGTVPETLSRTLHKLKDDGVLTCTRDTVTFPDPDRARAEIEDWEEFGGGAFG